MHWGKSHFPSLLLCILFNLGQSCGLSGLSDKKDEDNEKGEEGEESERGEENETENDYSDSGSGDDGGLNQFEEDSGEEGSERKRKSRGKDCDVNKRSRKIAGKENKPTVASSMAKRLWVLALQRGS